MIVIWKYNSLINMGFPKFAGGVGGYARFVAICPSTWSNGVSIDPNMESPLPKQASPLVWNKEKGMRVRGGAELPFMVSEGNCDGAVSTSNSAARRDVLISWQLLLTLIVVAYSCCCV
jgi:hypothetical protein